MTQKGRESPVNKDRAAREDRQSLMPTRSCFPVALVLPNPPLLRACLSCGWVHGCPWRCPDLDRDVKVLRVGKVNTLLVVPSDSIRPTANGFS